MDIFTKKKIGSYLANAPNHGQVPINEVKDLYNNVLDRIKKNVQKDLRDKLALNTSIGFDSAITWVAKIICWHYLTKDLSANNRVSTTFIYDTNEIAKLKKRFKEQYLENEFDKAKFNLDQN